LSGRYKTEILVQVGEGGEGNVEKLVETRSDGFESSSVPIRRGTGGGEK